MDSMGKPFHNSVASTLQARLAVPYGRNECNARKNESDRSKHLLPANPFKMGKNGKEERLRDVVCIAHKMRTQKLVDANLDYLRNGQGHPIAGGRTGENVLKSEEFKRQSIETHVKKKKASFKGVRGEEPVRKWHGEAEKYIKEVYNNYIWAYDEPVKEQEWISELRALVVRTRAGWHTHLLCACRERHQAQPECHGDALSQIVQQLAAEGERPTVDGSRPDSTAAGKRPECGSPAGRAPQRTMTVDPHAAGRLLRHTGVREQQQQPGTSAAPQTSSDDGDGTNESPNSEEESLEWPADEGGISDLEGESVRRRRARWSLGGMRARRAASGEQRRRRQRPHGAWLHGQASWHAS